MTRDEHLAWAKKRALEYVERGDIAQAVTSMLSDLSKHPELGCHNALAYAGMMFTKTPDEARRWIEGFR
jgi:hypothetical protein